MGKDKLTYLLIEDFLKKELAQSKHILTWGTIGSLNIKKDIDTIITKKPSSPSAEFFKEIHTIFENLDDYIKKGFNTRVIRFAQTAQEFLVKEYTKGNKILFHTMIYVSFPEIEKDWGWALSKGENINEILRETYQCSYGDIESIFTKEFKKENNFGNMFIYLYLYDSLNSNLPKKLFLETMNGCFEYIYKKRLGIDSPVAKDRGEVKKYFYELCNILDKKIKESTN